MEQFEHIDVVGSEVQAGGPADPADPAVETAVLVHAPCGLQVRGMFEEYGEKELAEQLPVTLHEAPQGRPA